MKKIVSISDAASLAMHTMAILAAHPDKMLSTREAANMLDASVHHLSKVLQRLQRQGMLKSVRGPRGGFRIADDWENITLMDIYEVMEGPFRPATCLLSRKACPGDSCILGSALHEVNEIIEKTLTDKTLGDLIKGFPLHNKNREKIS